MIELKSVTVIAIRRTARSSTIVYLPNNTPQTTDSFRGLDFVTADLKPALFEEFQARHIPGIYDLNCTIKTTAGRKNCSFLVEEIALIGKLDSIELT